MVTNTKQSTTQDTMKKIKTIPAKTSTYDKIVEEEKINPLFLTGITNPIVYYNTAKNSNMDNPAT